MEEVDYSRFLYRPASPKPPEKGNRNERPRHKTGKKKVFCVIIVIILCFSIVFLCVDFFSKGKILQSIYDLIASKQYSFYMTVKCYSSRETAHAGVLLAENGGGSGYLFQENSNFYVVFGTYLSYEDAKSVANKNAFEIYELKFSSSNKKLFDLIYKFVLEINIVLDNIDKGIYTESSLNSLKNNYIILFSSFETEKNEEKEFIAFTINCLNELSVGTTERTKLLFQTRHMICSILFSANQLLI